MKFPEKDNFLIEALSLIISFLIPSLGLAAFLFWRKSERGYRETRAASCAKASALGLVFWTLIVGIVLLVYFSSLPLVFQILLIVSIILVAIVCLLRIFVFAQDYRLSTEKESTDANASLDPYVGKNNNWWIRDIDTGISSSVGIESISPSKSGKSTIIHFSNGNDFIIAY